MRFKSLSKVTLTNPSRQLLRLCKHMGHKIPITHDEEKAELTFEFGVCQMLAEGNTLTMYCQTGSQEELEQMQDIMARHLEQIAWQDEPKITWQATDNALMLT